MAVAPLTILVGPNNAGKTALAKAIPLLAGGLHPLGLVSDTVEPFVMNSGGVRHGDTFKDLVTGRSPHGWLELSAVLADESNDLTLSVRVQNVESSDQSSERQISRWSLRNGTEEVVLTRKAFGVRSPYEVVVSGRERDPVQIAWRGLVPGRLDVLPPWVAHGVNSIRSWTKGVRYLQCPRRIRESPFRNIERPLSHLGRYGRNAPIALVADDELRESVRKWYGHVFGVSLHVVAQGNYWELEFGAPGGGTSVGFGQSGRGLSQVLPIAVMAMAAQTAGPGVDIIEHPEAELHPAVHAEIAELLLKSLAGFSRPLIVETHSEMILLRARRWIAEKRLPPEHVLVYWVSADKDVGSMLKQITIDERGDMSDWPSGVFIEDYEEALAIRRAAREED